MIETLRDEIERSGLLSEIQIIEDIVAGRARMAATDTEVWVNVDPELEDEDDPDIPGLLVGVERVLTLPAAQWRAIVGEVVTEIEDAVGDEPVDEAASLADDLALRSVVVFADATLLRLEAPRQFPGCWIHVQLDEELTLEDLTVDEKTDDEDVEFETLDELLDHLRDT
jgi:hypothetical protein